MLLLLSKVVDAQKDYRNSAVREVTLRGHGEIMSMLLDFGATDLDANERLHVAVRVGD